MESISNEKIIYSEIQKKLFYIIPEKWESIYLYASIIDMPGKRTTGEMYFYYFPKGIIKKKAVNCYEIPNAFNIDEDEYARLITDLYNLIKKLRQICIVNNQKIWTNVTISIQNFQFKIEYDYQDLQNSELSPYERHVIWRYIYLKPDIELLSKKEKNIISNYIQIADSIKIPKRKVYTEGIYKNPVKNIVDFEKTLSVEEALAQSEKIEEKPREKKKHKLFKRKQIIEDVIEESDYSEIINNQILNWKKNDEKK